MSDGTRERGEKGATPPDEAGLSARLRHLGERLDQVKSSRPPEHAAPRPQGDASGLARGLRLSTELVAGVIVGAAIGWFLDRWLGSSPWGFIVFLLLGFAAGILNVMRSAGLMAERREK
jgi:ATP synthase protein I